MRLQDWSGFGALAVALLSFVELARGNGLGALTGFIAVAVLGFVTRYWSVHHPAPMPHLLRWTLSVPRGNQTPAHLKRILEPRSGERMLEVGPGVGIHALPIASSLAPGGSLDVFDVQQKMLDNLMKRASEAGVSNIIAKQGDARRLPYPDATFDAAYLVGVLGEVPDGRAALRELRRVLKPDGRLVVGEVIFDPDFVPFRSLESRAREASFSFERKLGGSFSFLARFRPV